MLSLKLLYMRLKGYFLFRKARKEPDFLEDLKMFNDLITEKISDEEFKEYHRKKNNGK